MIMSLLNIGFLNQLKSAVDRNFFQKLPYPTSPVLHTHLQNGQGFAVSTEV